MTKNIQDVRAGGRLLGNFNKIIAAVGLGWLTSMVIVRYVIKPIRVRSRMQENEELMNYLYEEQEKHKNVQNEFKI